ncbi:hypothetical protein [Falsiporphyromonas endometrii]|uniref:Major fimbrial subunit protein N-terminal domain-containing protein n=1 Tax=Falsiporphyromonas endometrii TaxID=1387297 RepID=A0ABV9K610_9PORP
MRVIKTISLYIILLLCLSCGKADYEPQPIQQDTIERTVHVKLNVNTLKSTPRAAYPKVQTAFDNEKGNETRLNELRVIVFEHGESTSVLNLYFAKDAINDNQIKMKLSSIRYYDFFVIANENAVETTTTNSQLQFLKNPTITKDQLLEANVKCVNISDGQDNKSYAGMSTQDPSLLMTAQYDNVRIDLTKPQPTGSDGTEKHPFKLDLTDHNKKQRPHCTLTDRSGIELIRALAKVEVVFKNIIMAKRDYSWQDYTYSYALPLGFSKKNILTMCLLNIPEKYLLFPQAKYFTSDKVIIESPNYSFVIDDDHPNPIEDYIVKPEDNQDEIPIGGVLMTDYRLVYYIPENLIEKGSSGKELLFYFHYGLAGGNSSNNIEKTISQLTNGADNTLEGCDYAYMFEDKETSRPNTNSIYRNRHYKLTVNFNGKNSLDGIELNIL